MNSEISELTYLLISTDYESGYESPAEKYLELLLSKYNIKADAVLRSIYEKNMSNNHIVQHILFIIKNLSVNERGNLEDIPLKGLWNPNIDIQDLSVQCFKSWKDKKYLPDLIKLRDSTTTNWFKSYINEVIDELSEVT